METKYVNVTGIRTRYLEAGRGEALLLIHGGIFSRFCSAAANDWALNFDGLARSFHVFAIDKIGCGFTDNPRNDGDYIIGSTVQHAYDFLKSMKIDTAHVVGHSMGGYAACRLALEHPEAVRTVVIIDSATLMVGGNPIYEEWHRLASLIKDERDRQRYMAAANSFGSEHITEDFLDTVVEMAALPKNQEALGKIRGDLKQQFRDDLTIRQKETHEWIREGRLKAPTLIVWGFNDPSAKFDPVGLAAIQLILPCAPGAQVHILNRAGHYCFREQPDAFVAAVTSFIKSNPVEK